MFSHWVIRLRKRSAHTVGRSSRRPPRSLAVGEEPIFPNEPIWLLTENAVTSVPCLRYSKNYGVTMVTLSRRTAVKEPPSAGTQIARRAPFSTRRESPTEGSCVGRDRIGARVPAARAVLGGAPRSDPSGMGCETLDSSPTADTEHHRSKNQPEGAVCVCEGVQARGGAVKTGRRDGRGLPLMNQGWPEGTRRLLRSYSRFTTTSTRSNGKGMLPRRSCGTM